MKRLLRVGREWRGTDIAPTLAVDITLTGDPKTLAVDSFTQVSVGAMIGWVFRPLVMYDPTKRKSGVGIPPKNACSVPWSGRTCCSKSELGQQLACTRWHGEVESSRNRQAGKCNLERKERKTSCVDYLTVEQPAARSLTFRAHIRIGSGRTNCAKGSIYGFSNSLDILYAYHVPVSGQYSFGQEYCISSACTLMMGGLRGANALHLARLSQG